MGKPRRGCAGDGLFHPLVPDGGYDGVPVRYPGGYRSDRYYPSDEKNYLGNWALGLGVVSLLCCGIIFGIVAIVLGLQAQAAADRGLGLKQGFRASGGWRESRIGAHDPCARPRFLQLAEVPAPPAFAVRRPGCGRRQAMNDQPSPSLLPGMS